MTEQQLLEEIWELLQEMRAELGALREDVHTILEHLPMQMIPADPDSEVQ